MSRPCTAECAAHALSQQRIVRRLDKVSVTLFMFKVILIELAIETITLKQARLFVIRHFPSSEVK